MSYPQDLDELLKIMYKFLR